MFALALVSLPRCQLFAQGMEFRIIPRGQHNFRWSMTNAGPLTISIPRSFFANDNNLLISRSEHSFSGWGSELCLGPVEDCDFPPQPMQLQPNASRIEFVESFAELIVLSDPNRYLRCRWIMSGMFSPHILLACATGHDLLEPPHVGTAVTNAATHLAFIFNQSEPNDLAFIYLNGGKATNSLHSPIGPQSSLFISSPSIGYSNDVTSAVSVSTNALVAPRMAEHWRIPWPEVWDQIPAEDREKLEKAGAIDLRWKCGDLVSDPLPLWVGSLDGVTNCPYATGCF